MFSFVVFPIPLPAGVLFRNMGQSAYLNRTDARLPVAFLNAGGLYSSSYLISNMFENSYSTAIGAYGTGGLLIQDTVIYKTKGSGEDFALFMTDSGTVYLELGAD